ncbi:YlbF family regulator [Fictibacillus sp. KIGAM418]|uniref:UPF0342 protein LCY76_04465 n=2 Tax=Fictibacillus TaxID=1329200 RepID=A0A9X1X857_9BACL|nr:MULTISPECIES: YlbF family regulator [unclassified Fictibacillus]MCK6255857.1 YlbF family regulator [Fictibacillus marinisediminis]MED2972171.1 YlbF family regulator [Fictibacillus sp. B-59209]UZJ81191.1 YlbF family regulator [Fictibacillus sp. KU28468]
MMSNIYDLAYSLEKALRDSEDFQTLKQCYAEVNADAEAQKMFEEFRNLQMGLQQKQMTGEQVTQEEVEKAQAMFQAVQQNEIISKLMATEQRMSLTISDLNKIITKPLEEIYGPMVDNEQ